jgi:hypothetical protein
VTKGIGFKKALIVALSYKNSSKFRSDDGTSGPTRSDGCIESTKRFATMLKLYFRFSKENIGYISNEHKLWRWQVCNYVLFFLHMTSCGTLWRQCLVVAPLQWLSNVVGPELW